MVVRSSPCLEVGLLAGGAEELRTVFAVFNGWVFLAALTHYIVWTIMNLAQRESSRRCSSQYGSSIVCGGKCRFLTFGVGGCGGGNLKDSTTQWASKWRLAWPTKTGVKELIILGDY